MAIEKAGPIFFESEAKRVGVERGLERHEGKGPMRPAATASWQCPEEMAESQRKMAQQSILGGPANEPYFSSLTRKQPRASEPTSVDRDNGACRTASVVQQPESSLTTESDPKNQGGIPKMTEIRLPPV